MRARTPCAPGLCVKDTPKYRDWRPEWTGPRKIDSCWTVSGDVLLIQWASLTVSRFVCRTSRLVACVRPSRSVFRGTCRLWRLWRWLCPVAYLDVRVGCFELIGVVLYRVPCMYCP
ncbi:unnamed protein product, partial [Ectocarpus sp. 4 AP-2014]